MLTDTLPNGKLIRALCIAWKLPSLTRFYAVLNEPGLDPVVAEAYAIIQGGFKALAAAGALGEADPAVIDLLKYVDALPMPSKLAMEYAAGRKIAAGAAESGEVDTRPPGAAEDTAGDVGGRLAREWLGEDAALAWPDVTPGAGDWPKYPQHTCGAETATGTAITFRPGGAVRPPDSPRQAKTVVLSTGHIAPGELEAVRIFTPKWHSCSACYHTRVKRYASQVLWEMSRLHEDGRGLVCFILDGKEAHKRFAARVRQQRKRRGIEGGYIAYPQEDGRFYVVAHNDVGGIEGEPVPYTKPDIFAMVQGLVKTPEERRVSPSDGWGGPWQGSRGDGRRKFAQQQGEEDPGPNKQLWTKSSLEYVAFALGHELRPNADSLRMIIDPLEAYRKLTTAGVELYEKKTNRAGLNSVLDLVGGNVTHKAHDQEEDFSMCVMRDIQHEPAPPEDITQRELCFDLVFGGAI